MKLTLGQGGPYLESKDPGMCELGQEKFASLFSITENRIFCI